MISHFPAPLVGELAAKLTEGLTETKEIVISINLQTPPTKIKDFRHLPYRGGSGCDARFKHLDKSEFYTLAICGKGCIIKSLIFQKEEKIYE